MIEYIDYDYIVEEIDEIVILAFAYMTLSVPYLHGIWNSRKPCDRRLSAD